MRLSELIEALEDLAEQVGDDDPEVKVVHQPTYPLTISLTDSAALVDGTIYLAESPWTGNNYASEQVCEAVGYDQ